MHRHARFAFLVAVVLLVPWVLAACARRPAQEAVSAPAPAGAGAPTPAAPTPAPAPAPPAAAAAPPAVPAPEPAAPAPVVPRVPPAGFRAVDALADIYFDFDRYDIRPGDTKILDENAKWIKGNPNSLILIEGHADERGTNEYNLALGERRAKAAMNYLTAQGVEVSRVIFISYGEERPACTDRNETCWSRNRRAHFLVKGR